MLNAKGNGSQAKGNGAAHPNLGRSHTLSRNSAGDSDNGHVVLVGPIACVSASATYRQRQVAPSRGRESGCHRERLHNVKPRRFLVEGPLPAPDADTLHDTSIAAGDVVGDQPEPAFLTRDHHPVMAPVCVCDEPMIWTKQGDCLKCGKSVADTTSNAYGW